MSTKTPAAPWLRATDLRGLSRLAVDASVGIVGIAETLHHTITAVAPPLGRPKAPPRPGPSALVYGAVRGTMGLVGRTVDRAFALVTPPEASGHAGAPGREAALAALNGVWGDHLEASGNPLAIRMALRVDGRPLDLSTLADPQRRLLVLVHGLCMNDGQWQRQGHDHGRALAAELGFTPLWLHYNSGRSVAANGADLAAQLQQLVATWPVPVDELAIVGHSMGGLVARAALANAGRGAAWPKRLKKIAFLGTPHRGAPLERGGHLVDTLLGVSPYAAPFARLGRARSAGITDLRHGLPAKALPRGVQALALAATRGGDAASLASRTVGDGLVPVASALGLPGAETIVVTVADHWDLLSRRDVYERLRGWLG